MLFVGAQRGCDKNYMAEWFAMELIRQCRELYPTLSDIEEEKIFQHAIGDGSDGLLVALPHHSKQFLLKKNYKNSVYYSDPEDIP